MQDKLDDARSRVLERIIEWSSVKHDPSAPAHLRNLAAVFDILTEKNLAENRVTGPLTDSTGSTFYVDAYGRLVNWDPKSSTFKS